MIIDLYEPADWIKKIRIWKSKQPQYSSSTKTAILPQVFRDRGFNSDLYVSQSDVTTNYDFDAIKNSITGSTFYVDPTAIGSTNVGTIENPFLTLGTAISNPSAAIILCRAGTTQDITGTTGITISKSLQIGTYGGAGRFTLRSRPNLGSWTPHSSLANVYEATNPNTTISIGSLYDETNIDEDGNPIALTRVASAATVNTTLNSFFYDTTLDIVYVRLWDDRTPDSSVVALSSSTTFRLIRVNQTLTSNLAVHIENLNLYGANPLVISNVSTTFFWEFSAHNCSFSYAGQKDGMLCDGFARGHFKDCESNWNAGDGFNYPNAQAAFFVEWKCRARGSFAASDANNGSTAHLSFAVIRVGCTYLQTTGKCIQDIQDSWTYQLRCTSGDSRALATAHRAPYASNSGVAPTVTRMWIIECTSVVAAGVNKFWNFNNSIMNIYDGSVGNLLTGPNLQEAGSVLNLLTESEVYA